MFDFFTLKTGIQPHATLDGEDIFKTKRALNDLGYLNKPSWAKDDEDVSPVNDWASQDMFDATKTFQKDHGLTVDGIIKPNGETATALNKKLAERATGLMGEKTDGATTPEQPKLKSFDFWADQKRKAQPPTATELATTTPWFQSPTLPTVDGAVHSANGRAVKTLMNYSDPGEHPRWITEDIRNGVPNAVGTLGNLLVQLSQQDPDKAKTYSDRVLTQLPADKRAEIEKMGGQLTASEPEQSTQPMQTQNSTAQENDRFDTFTKGLFRREGGYINDPVDRGGETNHGVTKRTLETYQNKHGGLGEGGKHVDVKDLTLDQAKKVYKQTYYGDRRIGDIQDNDLAGHIFDLNVNHSPKTAGKLVQSSVNKVMPNARLAVDGIVGDKTVAALNRATPEQLTAINNAVVEARIAHFKKLTERDPSQKRFLKGWTNRANEFKK